VSDAVGSNVTARLFGVKGAMMRFKKGSIELSHAQDYPLLRQVMHCKFVSHDQAYEFMRIGCHELDRDCFNWRIKRLVTHDLLLRYHLPAVASAFIYSIGSFGALRLQGMGEYYCGPLRGLGKKIDEVSCFHSLELNDIHLALARRNLVEEWTSEVEIRSMNELTNTGYAKDYDAIVTLRDRSARSRFALEYERSPKSLRDYKKIRQAIETEDQVNVFLYLVPNHHLLSFVWERWAGTKRRLYFGLAHELTELGLEATVVEASTGNRKVLGKAL
jgi:hypothetical protein